MTPLRSRPVLNLPAGLIGLAADPACGQVSPEPPPTPPPGADTLDFTDRLGPLAPSNIFRNAGCYVWCGSCIRSEMTDTTLP